MKYKIFEYKDGYDNVIYRPKIKFWIFPIYLNIKVYDSEHSYYIREYSTKESAQNWINLVMLESALLRTTNFRKRIK